MVQKRPCQFDRCSTPEVNMGEPGSPIPPPAGGPGPQAGYGATGLPQAPARWAGTALTQGAGATGLPQAPARWAGAALTQGMGQPGCPRPRRPRESLALTQRDGETGFPHPLTRWAGAALTQGAGATGLPHAPARGRVWAGAALRRFRGSGTKAPVITTSGEGGGAGHHSRDHQSAHRRRPAPDGPRPGLPGWPGGRFRSGSR